MPRSPNAVSMVNYDNNPEQENSSANHPETQSLDSYKAALARSYKDMIFKAFKAFAEMSLVDQLKVALIFTSIVIGGSWCLAAIAGPIPVIVVLGLAAMVGPAMVCAYNFPNTTLRIIEWVADIAASIVVWFKKPSHDDMSNVIHNSASGPQVASSSSSHGNIIRSTLNPDRYSIEQMLSKLEQSNASNNLSTSLAANVNKFSTISTSSTSSTSELTSNSSAPSPSQISAFEIASPN